MRLGTIVTTACGWLVLALLVGNAAAAGDGSAAVSATDRRAIQGVIETQIRAFGRDDGSAAFALASPDIQLRFQTPEIFMRMVRRDYRPVYRPRRFEFRDVVDVDGVPVQKVYVVGPDGTPVIALYPMQKQADGSWRISGCYLVRPTERGA